ncbi:MAG: dihydrolipoyl dehydrogenase [Deltaproteobacteria bacterium]|nr:dihydrolipoyl dehydrogenase [Deltaproteobacteria bacterium]
MAQLVVRVPDIGDFRDVDVVEVLVRAGDRVEREQALVVIESDKASMEVPSPSAGVVLSVAVQVNGKVSEGDAILTLDVAEEGVAAAAPARAASAPAPQTAPAPTDGSRVQLLVLGGGPGGYTAAFRAADLGLSVTLVERDATLGGVCTNVGCIPSKALLHVAEVIEQARAMREHGVDFGEPHLDRDRIRAYKDGIVAKLCGGLAALAKARKVTVVRGSGRFVSPNELAVDSPSGAQTIAFEHAIVATGSRPVMLPGLPSDPRILDSTGALELSGSPRSLLVVGGGIIGLEMACVYLALGVRVTIVELMDRLLVGVDRDLARVLEKRLKERCEAIHIGTGVAKIEARSDCLFVTYDGPKAPPARSFDRVLVAVGRRANVEEIGLESLGVQLAPRGFVAVDAQCRTNVGHVFAIGDVTGPPQLAHRATHQGKVAAETIAGHKAAFEPAAIPSIAYTDPEVAWVGLTEEQATAQGVAVKKGVFPWSASGRALGMGRGEGTTKLLFSADDGRLLGAGMAGAHAGELIGEAALAIEMGADAHDLGLTIHAHPTLSETVAFAAEVAAGTATDVLPPRRK